MGSQTDLDHESGRKFKMLQPSQWTDYFLYFPIDEFVSLFTIINIYAVTEKYTHTCLWKNKTLERVYDLFILLQNWMKTMATNLIMILVLFVIVLYTTT